ncbi:MAG: carboxypeptidase regulatory-like domain-containing protein [Bacteroidota bacterium]
MISYSSYIKVLALLSIVLMSSQCENEDDVFNKLYGSHTIQGVVLYRDATTNVLDTARGAYLELRSNDENLSDLALRKDLSVDAEKGEFKFTSLPSGIYKLTTTYLVGNITYEDDKTIDTGGSEYIDAPGTIELGLNNEIDYKIASVSGRVLFKDIFTDLEQPAAGAKVVLRKDSGGFVEEYTAMTNDQGDFTINGLPEGPTYKVTASYQQQSTLPITIDYKIAEKEVTVVKNKPQTPNGLKKLQLIIAEGRLINPLLQITTKDIHGTRLRNAQVFLYESEKTRGNDNFQGLTNIASGTTNERGIALIPNLEMKTYYISSLVIIGEDTLTTKGSTNMQMIYETDSLMFDND